MVNKLFFKWVFIVTLLVYSVNTMAQPWMYLVENKDKGTEPGFYQIQKAFYTYWEPYNVKRGKMVVNGVERKAPGWKQFKRWENFMIPRIYPNGYFPANQTYNEIVKLNSSKKQTVDAPVWKASGPTIVPLDLSGQRTGIGRLNCVVEHPANPLILFAGAPAGGLWKSTDGGVNWSTASDGFTNLGVSDIAINPLNPDEIYIATGDGDAANTYSYGILKSTDGGNTFLPTGKIPYKNYIIRKVIINPDNPQILIAATNAGIFRTDDGGATWSSVGIEGSYRDVKFQPGNSAIVYAARYSTANIYRSIDGGLTFSESGVGIDFSDVQRIELAVSPAKPLTLWALLSNKSDDGLNSLWKSDDAGQTWTKFSIANNLLGWYEGGDNDKGGQGWYDLTLTVSPVNPDIILVGGVNLWKTTNGGLNWKLAAHWYGGFGAPYVHADHHWTAYTKSGALFNGNDGGFYKSMDNGDTWSDLSDNLQITQIDRISTSATNPGMVVIGNQDNGTMLFKDGKINRIYGGDGGENIIDYKNPDIIYASYVLGELLRSDNGGSTWNEIRPENTDGAWLTPFIMHPENPEILYAGYKLVYKSTNRGESWKRTSESFTSNELITQIALAPSNTNYIYASTGSVLWVSENDGATWKNISSGTVLAGKYITYIAVSESDPRKVFVTVSGYEESNKIYQTTDGGLNWVNISDGLPNVPANCIVLVKRSLNEMFVGTDIGVFYRNDSLNAWQLFGKQLPNVIVNELEINYSDNKLYAGTYGRGLWSVDLPKLDTDLNLVEALTDTFLYCNKNNLSVKYLIKNSGKSTISGFSVNYVLNNTDTVKTPVSVVLNSGETYEFTTSDIALNLGDNVLLTFISHNTGEMNFLNDTIKSYFKFSKSNFPDNEDFNDFKSPDCWNVDALSENGESWLFNNPMNRSFSSATGANGFAIADCKYYGGTANLNTSMHSPEYNFLNVSFVTLRFAHHFKQGASSLASFDYSTDNGLNWSTLQAWNSTIGGLYAPELYVQNVTDLVAGKESVMFRWKFTGTASDFYWIVDDFILTTNDLTSVKDADGQPVLIYPNPASTFLTISYTKPVKPDAIYFTDLTGRRVNVTLVENGNSYLFDVQHLNKGVYFVNILINDKLNTYKVILQ